MRVLLWITYATGLLATWFENRFLFYGIMERPLWYSRNAQGLFGMAQLTLVFGSVIAIWYFIGWQYAIASFVVYFTLSQMTCRKYLRQAILDHFHTYESFLTKKEQGAEKALSDQERSKKALSLAASQVLENMGTSDLMECHDPDRNR